MTSEITGGNYSMAQHIMYVYTCKVQYDTSSESFIMHYMCAIIRTSKIRLLILGSYPVFCKHQLFGIT